MIREPVGEFLFGAGDEVPEPIGFEPQAEAFDGVEVGRVAGQELGLEVMPVQVFGLVPGSVVQDQQLPEAFLLGDGFGKLVQKTLEHGGVHAVHYKGEEFAALRGDRPDDVLPDMIT